MNTFWRWWFATLCELVVIATAGTWLGPLFGGTWGYLWGYLSGLIGPVSLIVAMLSVPLWARERHLI